MLKRARSWITRSRPSYANGADESFLFCSALTVSLQTEVKQRCGGNLPEAKCRAHRPGAQRLVSQRHHVQPSQHIKPADQERRLGQKPARREHAQAEDD